MKEVFHYGGEGSLVTHSVYAYDGSKRLKSMTEKNAKKEIVKSIEFEYDAAGNRTGEATYDKYSNTRKNFVWVYKNGVKVTENLTIISSNKKRTEQREFNKEGNEISYSNLDDFNRKIVYAYDSHNNWITATYTFKNFEGKNAAYRMVREIKYY